MAGPDRRPRAPRLDPDTRRGLIVDAAEHLLAEHDPLLVTFEQVADAAGVSRPLVHTYLGDRRGLIDAVQVRIIGRLDTWVGHGLARADSPADAWRAVVHGVLAFVESEHDGWSVLSATGGLDHPALHGLRQRWAATVAAGDDARSHLASTAAIGALLLEAAPWANRGVDASEVLAVLDPAGHG
ncbi:MAG: TetR/AcrR family transcriptional regulator [Acidimicrobiales bacterium]|nr:TetR family transcriptional regulator [Acidimicrobiales bacterium]